MVECKFSTECGGERIFKIGQHLEKLWTKVSWHLNNNYCYNQRISVVVQRFNGVLLHDGFCVQDQPE